MTKPENGEAAVVAEAPKVYRIEHFLNDKGFHVEQRSPLILTDEGMSAPPGTGPTFVGHVVITANTPQGQMQIPCAFPIPATGLANAFEMFEGEAKCAAQRTMEKLTRPGIVVPSSYKPRSKRF